MLQQVVGSYRKAMTHPVGKILCAQILGEELPSMGLSAEERNKILFGLFSALRRDPRVETVPWDKHWSGKGKYPTGLAQMEFEFIAKSITPDNRQVLILPLEVGSLVIFEYYPNNQWLGYHAPSDYENNTGRLCDSRVFAGHLEQFVRTMSVDTAPARLNPVTTEPQMEDVLMNAEVIASAKLFIISNHLKSVSLHGNANIEEDLYAIQEQGNVRFIARLGDEVAIILQPEVDGPLIMRASPKTCAFFGVESDSIVGHKQFEALLIHYNKERLLRYLNFQHTGDRRPPNGVFAGAKHYAIEGIRSVADVAESIGLLKRW